MQEGGAGWASSAECAVRQPRAAVRRGFIQRRDMTTTSGTMRVPKGEQRFDRCHVVAVTGSCRESAENNDAAREKRDENNGRRQVTFCVQIAGTNSYEARLSGPPSAGGCAGSQLPGWRCSAQVLDLARHRKHRQDRYLALFTEKVPRPLMSGDDTPTSVELLPAPGE